MGEPDLDAVKYFIKTVKPTTAKKKIADQILHTTTEPAANGMPAHLKHNPFVGEPLPAPKEIELSVVIDSEHPKRGYIVLAEDKESGVAYLPEGMSVKQVNHALVQDFITAGYTEILCARVMSYDIKPMEQRTCIWFTSGDDNVDSFAAETSDHYEFDRPHPYPVCSNPEIKKLAQRPNPGCDFSQTQAQCDYYTPEPVKLIRAINLTIQDNQNEFGDCHSEIVEVKTTRYAYGMRKYIVSHGPAGEAGTVDFELTATEHKDKLNEVLEEKLTELIAGLEPVDMEEIPVDEATVEKNRYFDYVLEG
jgi:hypothetical protein